ncbi:MAG TPA: hypothetical protein DEP91_10615 [Sphingomonas bacterium]|uniref:asparagine synthase (glutamine-hydrolyzing) n=1 Tax=Sphingomonas bacterium TaxID=1895847 RepID=A0A3D0WCY4_9SPHN|nr:hypothetical protein [Sphingomonas bacterium]
MARPSILLFALVWLSAAWFGSWHWNPNSAVRLFAAIGIAERQDAAIDRFEALTIDKARFGAHFYLDKPPGMMLMAVPVVALADAATHDSAEGKVLATTDPVFDRYMKLRQWLAAAAINATLLALAEDGAAAYAKGVGVTRPELRARLYTDAMMRALGDHAAEVRYWRTMKAAPGRDALDAAQYSDFKHWLPGDILTKIDRTSMAVSLEAREPLLDHRLIEFAATLPPAMRIRAGQGKWLMKKAMEPYLPRDILYRPKMGFVTPVSAWFRGALAGEAAALVRSPILASWFEPAAIETLASDHRTGRADHGRTLWQLLMLERSVGRLFG